MLTIKKNVYDEILGHAKKNPLAEVCGLLGGRDSRVDKIYKMTNTSDTPDLCYFMDPKEQLTVMKKMREIQMQMVAIYHSHTHSEAYPSAKDVALAYYPDSYYIIVSLTNKPNVRAFRIVDEKITEEKIEIE
ncbi:M67 family metallopeptidase [Candidatus Saganbacteria bacterium]|nr:M67 family metallopeptidase [Candidatus Saganbacteria bacterium]